MNNIVNRNFFCLKNEHRRSRTSIGGSCFKKLSVNPDPGPGFVWAKFYTDLPLNNAIEYISSTSISPPERNIQLLFKKTKIPQFFWVAEPTFLRLVAAAIRSHPDPNPNQLNRLNLNNVNQNPETTYICIVKNNFSIIVWSPLRPFRNTFI
jgi:hypothetical protein